MSYWIEPSFHDHHPFSAVPFILHASESYFRNAPLLKRGSIDKRITGLIYNVNEFFEIISEGILPAFTQEQNDGLSSNLSKDEIARCLSVRTEVAKKYREKQVTSTFWSQLRVELKLALSYPHSLELPSCGLQCQSKEFLNQWVWVGHCHTSIIFGKITATYFMSQMAQHVWNIIGIWCRIQLNLHRNSSPVDSITLTGTQ